VITPIDKNSLWGGLNIQKRELCVKCILAQQLRETGWGLEAGKKTGGSSMHIAILDDYFDAARHLADWGQLAGRADIQVFTEPLGGGENAAKKLADFEIIVGMRERTPFPATLIRRLPKLKLLITTGMRNLSFDGE
jgi:hypothetical protein